MSGEESYLEKLRLADRLRTSMLSSAIQALGLPRRSRGLDAGCGAGSLTFLLAEAVGAAGHVTGIDVNPEFLAHAQKTAEDRDLAKRTSFQQGDVRRLPFEANSFNWACSVDCVGFIPASPVRLLKELARVVKPGGAVAILLWSSQQLLPGYPLLEARLNATSLGIAPFTAGKTPDQHHLRALNWFQKAGLKALTAGTFVGDVHAPFDDDERDALRSLIEMRWGDPQSELTPPDRALYQRLSNPTSPACILNLSDYYAFFTYSMFRGTVGK